MRSVTEKMHRRNVNYLTDLSVQITTNTSENVHRVIHSIKLLQHAYTGYYVMRKGGSDMDSFQLSMIQKAIHRTYDELGKEVDSQGVIVDEIQKAQEEYLSALSHETAIDKRYLKSLI